MIIYSILMLSGFSLLLLSGCLFAWDRDLARRESRKDETDTDLGS
jgi:hypothetical protein